ncbi:MAG: hypothetical protein J6C64_06940 [Lachnospiraceae bacterium]|nr:hypothetical protein [Lachnospiraceae bacterium]
MANVITIVCFVRMWNSNGGILERNHLLTEKQSRQLLEWINMIEYEVICLLDGAVEEAFGNYEEYLNNRK